MASRTVFTALRNACSRSPRPIASSLRASISNTTRLSSTTRSVAKASEPPHVPKPIPLDIGSSSSSTYFTPTATTATSSTATSSTSTSTSPSGGLSKRPMRGFGPGSAFDRFGGPIIKVIIYSTAVTLAMHLAYHRLALEELKITTNAKLKDLEDEIAQLKSEHRQSVQHATGGRGEFI